MICPHCGKALRRCVDVEKREWYQCRQCGAQYPVDMKEVKVKNEPNVSNRR